MRHLTLMTAVRICSWHHVDDIPEQHIGDQARVLKGLASCWGDCAVLQPAGNGFPLIAEPISSYHAVNHCDLQSITVT